MKQTGKKADYIVKNARVFTAGSETPNAEGFAVKDGKFVYVGTEAGLSEYEGEVMDLGGKFVMPGLIDSHVHICSSVAADEHARGRNWFVRDQVSGITEDGLTR